MNCFWIEVMYQATDGVGPWSNATRYDTPWNCFIFFLLFVFTTMFFVINLVPTISCWKLKYTNLCDKTFFCENSSRFLCIFVSSCNFLNQAIGVILDSFNDMKKESKSGGGVMLTPQQIEWVHHQQRTRAFMLATQYKKQVEKDLSHLSRTNASVYRLVAGSRFDNLIMMCIFLNGIVLSMAVFPSPSQEYDNILEGVNTSIVIIFNLEMLLKFYGLGLKEYFSSVLII